MFSAEKMQKLMSTKKSDSKPQSSTLDEERKRLQEYKLFLSCKVPRNGKRIPAILLGVCTENIFRLAIFSDTSVEMFVNMKLTQAYIPDIFSTNNKESEAARRVHGHILCLVHMHEMVEIRLAKFLHYGLYEGHLYLGKTELGSILTSNGLAKIIEGKWSTEELETIIASNAIDT